MQVKAKDLLILKVHGEYKYFVRLRGKGDKSRLVPIGMDCVELIKKRKAWLEDEELREKIIFRHMNPATYSLYRQKWKKKYLFFEVVDGNTISKVFLQAKRACGIPEHLTFHSARHTYATHMLSEGVELKMVSRLLGHSDVKTTEIYAKVLDKALLKQTERTSEL